MKKKYKKQREQSGKIWRTRKKRLRNDNDQSWSKKNEMQNKIRFIKILNKLGDTKKWKLEMSNSKSVCSFGTH